MDVEHRFPEHLAQKNKKKSTRCRMVFRTQLTRDNGSTETLQVCSNPIICSKYDHESISEAKTIQTSDIRIEIPYYRQ